MVGRILAYLARRGVLRELAAPRIGVRQRRWPRPHAVRLPADWPVKRPGDLVELDTLQLRTNARASTAVGVLDALAARMSFAVQAISVDNGSEFMAAFEAACAARGIILVHLPPRSPKLQARSNGPTGPTPRSYELTDAASELEALQAELTDWELRYKTIRPHQALGYLTPAEYLASVGVHV